MTYDPHKRDSSWTMIAPGLYSDPAGNGHVFPDEIIAELSRQQPEIAWDYDEDYELVVQVLTEQLHAAGMKCPIKIIRHEREKN